MKMTKLLVHTMCSAGLVTALAAGGCTTSSSDDGIGDGSTANESGNTGASGDPCEKIAAAYGGLFSQIAGVDGTLAVHLASAGREWSVAQVIAPSTTGRMSRVRLALTWSGHGSGEVVVSLIDLGGDASHLTDRAFIAEDHVIATTNVAVGAQESWVNVPFANLPQVTALKPYAIEVHVAAPAAKDTKIFGDNSVLWNAFAAIPSSLIDPYPAGHTFLRNPTTANQWSAAPTAFGVTDQVFETYVIGANCR
jgi:hypothetical protein